MVDFQKIEKKWQLKWENSKIFQAKESKKKKFYILEMYPYPSSHGLHMGHARNYIIGDVYVRYKRMNDFNVLYPMGYDSFGLPAENAAIKAKSHPKLYTEKAIENFIKQQKSLGLSYDWSRLIMSHDPNYYKWDQWLFLQLLKKGLAYKKKSAVNWCPKCKTVLANEQVKNGKCWRHEDTDVEIKELEQWFFKITDYADRLLKDIEKLNWPEDIKTMQRNWIGKSEGTGIEFEIPYKKETNFVLLHGYTGNPDANFFPWLKKELEYRGYKVYAPKLPDTNNPNIIEQAEYVLKNCKFNENTVLLGHSLGCVIALKVLERLNKPIKKLVLAAGFAKLGFKDKPRPFEKTFDGKFAFDKIRKNAGQVIILRAKNDSVVPAERADSLQGKIGGAIIDFKAEEDHICGNEEPVVLKSCLDIQSVFTTRPDTLFGVTFVVFAPEHPKVLELVKGTKYEKQVKNFINKVVLEERFLRTAEDREKEGIFLGKYAINPANNEKIPIYIANFVLLEYGTGIVMAVPAHDQRDYEFAKKYKIPIKIVITPKESNCIVVHGSPEKEKPNEPKENERHWLPWIKKELEKQGIKTYIPLMPVPWNPKYEEWKKEFEKLNVNENSILIGHSAGTAFLVRWLGDTNKKIKKLILVGPGKISSHERTKELYDFKINKNIKNLVDEIIIFISNDAQHHIDSAKIYEKELNGKFIKIKNKGHFTFRDMGTKEFPELLSNILNLTQAYINEGILINSGKFNGINNQNAKEEITKHLEKTKQGKKTTQFKLRDWLISRQRYWGCPIPIIYCNKCGIVPVSEKDLPVKLPERVSFAVKGNPLASSKEFINTNCPKCKSKARRETDTMDTFIDSSWYFLRYCDSKNNNKIFDSKKANHWMPVDQYIGGKEHACGHLIYSRFILKFLHDLELIKVDEPFQKLFNQGMLHKGGFVMSKSRGNVVTPEEISEKYGIDTARLFLSFVAEPDKDMEWSEEGIQGMHRFIFKLLSLHEKKFTSPSKLLISKSNRLIKNVTENIENFKYNLAIINLMEFVNYLNTEEISKEAYEILLKLLSPFAPHISEELWEKLDHKEFISKQSWPKYNSKAIDEKAELEYELINKTISDINNIRKLVKLAPSSIYIYVIPKELQLFETAKEKIKKAVNLKIKVFAVNDKNKYDPQNKSQKAKPGKPALYME